jgi:hypothetical protein
MDGPVRTYSTLLDGKEQTMRTIRHRITRSLLAIALLGSVAAVAAPATHAAPAPSLTITAQHGVVLVNGANFSNYQSVTLRVYGLDHGQRVPFANTQITSFPTTDHSLVWYFHQVQDPCSKPGGYLALEVDAYGWATPVVTSGGVAASITQPALTTSGGPEITSIIGSVYCGLVIQ